jgi:hypothetical protein
LDVVDVHAESLADDDVVGPVHFLI